MRPQSKFWIKFKKKEEVNFVLWFCGKGYLSSSTTFNNVIVMEFNKYWTRKHLLKSNCRVWLQRSDFRITRHAGKAATVFFNGIVSSIIMTFRYPKVYILLIYWLPLQRPAWLSCICYSKTLQKFCKSCLIVLAFSLLKHSQHMHTSSIKRQHKIAALKRHAAH